MTVSTLKQKPSESFCLGREVTSVLRILHFTESTLFDESQVIDEINGCE